MLQKYIIIFVLNFSSFQRIVSREIRIVWVLYFILFKFIFYFVFFSHLIVMIVLMLHKKRNRIAKMKMEYYLSFPIFTLLHHLSHFILLTINIHCFKIHKNHFFYHSPNEIQRFYDCFTIYISWLQLHSIFTVVFSILFVQKILNSIFFHFFFLCLNNSFGISTLTPLMVDA